MTSHPRADHVEQLANACEKRGLWIELTATHGTVDQLRIRNRRTRKVIASRDIDNHPREIDQAARQLLEDLTTP